MAVCNLNRIHCENLANVLEENACSTGTDNCMVEKYDENLTFTELVEFAQLTGCQDESSSSSEATTQKTIIKDVNGNELNENFSNENIFLQKYVSLPWKLRQDIGYQFEDFVRGCVFKGVDCTNGRQVVLSIIHC